MICSYYKKTLGSLKRCHEVNVCRKKENISQNILVREISLELQSLDRYHLYLFFLKADTNDLN